MQGLWSEHFPPAETPRSPPDGYERCLICPKCNAACRLRTSTTQLNPNREFYKCPARDHKFFKWADTVNPSEFIDVPYCRGCMAGVCRVRREKTGPNAGRILFLCRIEEGYGSCGYRVWQDELENSEMEADERITSTTTNCGDNSSTNVDLVEEITKNGEGADKESPAIETLQNLQGIEAASGKMMKFKYQEEKLHESSRRPAERSRSGDLKAPGSLISTCTRTMHLAKTCVSLQHCWMAAAIRQNLSSELQGWWGRLAFHPMPTPSLIINASCYVSSTAATDYTCPVPDKIPANSESLSTITRSVLEVQSFSKPLVHNAAGLMMGTKPFQAAVDVSCISNHFPDIRYRYVMTNSISKALGQAAAEIQSKFLTLLETMDVQDHEALSREAEATFVALDLLKFDYQDLQEHTMKIIHCAMTLSEIEQSVPTNDSYQKLLDHCSSERIKLDKISHIHADMVQTLKSSKNHIRVLQEKISLTKNWLSELETESTFCEAELKNMELELDQISESKENLEQKYLIAAKELEEFQILCEHKKSEHDAAKGAFDGARSWLQVYRSTR